ncbi:MAG: hypothetical protein JKY19_06350 [Alcanivoracaceae bacterium]|nr:hypothetical protein [Alcanivoracaceae bacterium]
MKEKKADIEKHSRSEVIRDTFVLQLKLIVDGIRDLLLMPLVVLATISGLLLHTNNPGRYLYRLLSYGKASEKWIGLFDEAEKDNMTPLDLKEQSLDDLIKKTQNAFESKYVDETKKVKLLNKLNSALDDINTKINPEKKT